MKRLLILTIIATITTSIGGCCRGRMWLCDRVESFSACEASTPIYSGEFMPDSPMVLPGPMLPGPAGVLPGPVEFLPSP